MKKIVLLFSVVISTVAIQPVMLIAKSGDTQTVTAGDSEPVSQDRMPEQSEGWRTHNQCILMPSISAGLMSFTFFSGLLGLDNYWAEVAIMGAAHVPAYFNNPLHGLYLSLTFGGLLGAENLIDSDEAEMFDDFVYTGMAQTGMFATYVAYRDARVDALPGVYDDEWRYRLEGLWEAMANELFIGENKLDKEWKPYTFGELLFAPLDKRHYADPLLIILPIAGFIKPLIVGSHEDAPWTTGHSYIGGWEVPAYVSIPAMLVFFFFESSIIATAEESLFRGFIYEDLASRGNLLAAKIIDPLYFSAIHIPQEIDMDYPAGTIVLDFLQRSLLTFYIDIFYDRGGLTHSVTTHMLIDWSQLFSMWLVNSGAPQTGIESIMGLIPPAGVTMRMAF